MAIRGLILEVTVSSVAGALAAARGGANRIELAMGLDLGGLTPTPGLVCQVRQQVTLPIFALLRPRPGSFVYGDHDLRVMADDLVWLREAKVDGLVFGALTAQGGIDWDVCQRLLALAKPRPCVFHRAFDLVDDQARALEELIDLGFQRVLTSGGQATAVAGADQLKRLIDQAKGRIEILPGGGIRADKVIELIRLTQCTQVHGSFLPAAQTTPFGRDEAADAAAIGEVRRLLDHLA